jgi:Protein of unknown function (DUF3039)
VSTQTVERVEIDPTTGEPRASHIVPAVPGKSGPEVVMEARINGTPVTALCGYTWVPQRDPKQYPVCTKCAAIFKEQNSEGADDGWSES